MDSASGGGHPNVGQLALAKDTVHQLEYLITERGQFLWQIGQGVIFFGLVVLLGHVALLVHIAVLDQIELDIARLVFRHGNRPVGVVTIFPVKNAYPQYVVVPTANR
ncbi:hypothetical protein [Aeromonas caviae]|uniref:hypothetical protein n=1 Tax=Aeromonas caviae TaxID=648 RepID=UPI00059DCF55|nr:hypothetical protein [Aeromonas caviae]